MALKKTLYQLLEVHPDASPEILKAAYEVRFATLTDAVSPEDLSNRAILRDAFELLNDPVRRKQYDERLREERIRALSSGGEEEARPRPANARSAAQPEADEGGRHHAQMMYGLSALVIAGVVGAWVYFDHTRKVAAQRIEAERIAADAKRRADDAQKRDEILNWAKDRVDTDRQSAEDRRRQAENERARRQYVYEQQMQSQQATAEERRRQEQQRSADIQRQREEQEALRRSQTQLERDRRHLRELENNRTMRF